MNMQRAILVTTWQAEPTNPPPEAVTKEQYQLSYSQYKLDDQLRRIHQLPFIIWSNHETCNDAWREGGENHTPAAKDLTS